MSGFVLHPEAYTDLEEVWDYIAADSLDAADRVREEIYDAIQSLAAFPHTGHSRPDKPLAVIAVLHGRRSPRVIAATLRGRTSQAAVAGCICPT
jgi:plasmid stabilization system protein ParE